MDTQKAIAAGLLLIGGAVTIQEARKMAELPPLTEKQEQAIRQMYGYAVKSGRFTCFMSPQYWAWAAFNE